MGLVNGRRRINGLWNREWALEWGSWKGAEWKGLWELLSHIQCYLVFVRAVNFNLELLSCLLVLYTFICTLHHTFISTSTSPFTFHLHFHFHSDVHVHFPLSKMPPLPAETTHSLQLERVAAHIPDLLW